MLSQKFRLAGAAVGNGLTDPAAMALTMADSYHALGLLDGREREEANALERDCAAKAGAAETEAEWDAATAARDAFQVQF